MSAGATGGECWKPFIDKLLESNCKEVAIIGHDGCLWASSNGYAPSPYETLNLAKAFLNPSEFMESGLFLAGKSFVVLKSDKRSIYGKKNGTGVFCAKTNLSIVIATYDDNFSPGKICNSVEVMADYLLENGY